MAMDFQLMIHNCILVYLRHCCCVKVNEKDFCDESKQKKKNEQQQKKQKRNEIERIFF